LDEVALADRISVLRAGQVATHSARTRSAARLVRGCFPGALCRRSRRAAPDDLPPRLAAAGRAPRASG
jgi:hypothetical protein